MTVECGVLLLTNILLVLIERVVRGLKWPGSSGEVPLWVSLPLSAGALSALTIASWAAFGAATGQYSVPVLLAVFILAGVPTVALYVDMVMAEVVSNLVDGLFGWRPGQGLMPSDLSRARTLAKRNDVAGAVREYQRYYDETPKDPRPLFAAAALLESRGDFVRARNILREIMEHFQLNDAVWGEAAYRLAGIEDGAMRDRPSANALWREICRRTPNSEVGGQASERLAEQWG